MTLDIVLYRADTPWAAPVEDAMLAGLRAHGLAPEERSKGDWRVSDLAIVWNHRDTELHAMQREAGAHYLVMERGYIGDITMRREWTSLGFDGLNGRAKFPDARDGGERWQKHFGHMMKPWRNGRKDGDYALLMGQVRGDASLAGVNMDDFYLTAVLNCCFDWKLPVMFRPHPRDADQPLPHGAMLIGGTLEDALKRAALVVTFNSGAGVDAVLAGVPTIARDRGSMVWGVAAYDWDHCARQDRTAWARKLAWCQYTADEISSGFAWECLREVRSMQDLAAVS
jgi:hypothetical protein